MKLNIKVGQLEYPLLLGNNNEVDCEEIFGIHNACTVIHNLIENGQLAEGFDCCYPNNLQEIISNLSEEQRTQCHKSALCGPLILKMQAGEYTFNQRETENNIQVFAHDNKFLPVEGKHRACVAKNFLKETDEIPVLLEK